MSTPRHAPETPLADWLASAPFVGVVAAPDGDSLAAAGLLAAACRSVGTPFQLRVAPPLGEPTGPLAAGEDDRTVAVGPVAHEADRRMTARPASAAAYEAAREMGASPDPVLALAGTVAAGDRPEAAADALQAAEGADLLSRRPGVAVPTADLADGLAASTLLAAPFSGDVESARATLAEMGLSADLDDEGQSALDGDAHRRVASLVAVETATAGGATPRAAEAVERALHPYALAEGPFETLGGYADVLDAVAREAPGVGVTLALGSDAGEARTAALDAWRRHAAVAHRLLRDAETARHPGLAVARVGASPEEVAVLPTVARLFRDFRSPEDVALVVAEFDGCEASGADETHTGAAAAASVDDLGLGEWFGDAADRLADSGDATADGDDAAAGDGDETTTAGGARTATARFDSTAQRFTDAVREVR